MLKRRHRVRITTRLYEISRVSVTNKPVSTISDHNSYIISSCLRNPIYEKWLPCFEVKLLKPNDETMIADMIKSLAEQYSEKLNGRIEERVEDMKSDDKSHYLIYQVLGITDEEGELIDIYQNKGRFLYRYAGSFLEEAVLLCLKYKYPDAQKNFKVENTLGSRPKRFEIDCLNKNDAIEIKWRDATTDGDHITKEHTRLKVIAGYGYKPIRVMFYYPNRKQAIRIQDTLHTLYSGLKGEYYSGDESWEFIQSYSGINLKEILEGIASANTSKV